MQVRERLSLEQIRALLEASDEVGFKGQNREEVYRWVGQTLWYATPWEILRRLPGMARHLKPDVTVEDLERTARAMTDTAAALAMQNAKRKLFAGFLQRRSA